MAEISITKGGNYARKYARYRHLVFDLTGLDLDATDVFNPGLFPAFTAIEGPQLKYAQLSIGSDGLITSSASSDNGLDAGNFLHVWATNHGVPDGSSADINADGSLTAGAIKRAAHRYGRFKHHAAVVASVSTFDELTLTSAIPYVTTGILGTTGASAWEGDAATDAAMLTPLWNTTPGKLIATVGAGTDSGVVHWWSTNSAGRN